MQQGSLEWHELRKNKIGASDACVIMGVNPWKTPYELWLEKTGVKECQVNDTMRWGLENEVIIREQLYTLTGIATMPAVRVHTQHDWLMASLDGLSSDGKTCAEFKSHKKSTDFDYVRQYKEPPPKYYPQCQIQMYVLDLQSMFYICNYNREYELITVHRNQEYIDEMLPKLKAFHDCLMNGTPPPMGEKDKSIRDDKTWEDLSTEWLTVVEQMAILKEKENSLRIQIIEECGDKGAEGFGISVTKSHPKGRIDYDLLFDAYNVADEDDYRKSSKEVWSIRKQKSS